MIPRTTATKMQTQTRHPRDPGFSQSNEGKSFLLYSEKLNAILLFQWFQGISFYKLFFNDILDNNGYKVTKANSTTCTFGGGVGSCTCCLWKFLGQGLNLSLSRSLTTRPPRNSLHVLFQKRNLENRRVQPTFLYLRRDIAMPYQNTKLYSVWA